MIATKFARVEFTEGGCNVWFVDGSVCQAWHHPEDSYYREIAQRLGYGARTVAYCRDHELSHLIFEEVVHGRPSPVLYALAHGRPMDPKLSAYEEIAAQALQRWVRVGERPIVGGVDWDKLKRRFLEVAPMEMLYV